MNRRSLRTPITVLVILGFTGFFAFSTFLFNPFEGDYAYDVASLVPRDVDVFVSKEGLIDDFDDDLRPEFAANFLASKNGQAVAQTVFYRDLMAQLDLESSIAALEEQLAQLPIDVQPLELFGGQEVVVGAYLPAGNFDTANWLVAGRIDWKAKLGISMLDYPGAIGLGAQGILVDELDGGAVTLSGGQLTQPLSLWRKADVLVISNQSELIARAQELDANGGEDSFLQSARYADQIAFKGRDGNEVELFCDWAQFAAAAGIPSNVLDPNSDEFLPSYFGKLLATNSVRELAGTLAFDRGVTLRLNGPISSEVLTAVQKRIHNQRSVRAERVAEMARMAAADTGLFAVFGGSVDDLLEQALLTIEPSARQLVDDAARSVWGYPDASLLVEDLDAALGSRVALIMRDLDYPQKPEDPPANDVAVPAWCLVFAVQSEAKVRAIKQKIVDNASQFGLQGNDRGSVFTHRDGSTGVEVTEYWSPLIAGTGHLASLVMGGSGQGGTYLLIGNHYQIVQDALRSYYTRENSADLESKVNFKTMLNAGLGGASLYVWFEPRVMHDTIVALSQQMARDTVVIDWSVERPRLERRLIEQEFGAAIAADYPNVSDEVTIRIDELYGPAAKNFEAQFYAQHVPDFASRYANNIEALESIDSVLIQLLLESKKFDLYLRAFLAPNTLEAAQE